MSESTGGWSLSVGTSEVLCRGCKRAYTVALLPSMSPETWRCRECLKSLDNQKARTLTVVKSKVRKVEAKRHARDASKPGRPNLVAQFARLKPSEISDLISGELDRTEPSAEVMAFLTNAMAERLGWSPKTGSDPLNLLQGEIDKPTLKAIRKLLGKLKRPTLKVSPKGRINKREGWLPSEAPEGVPDGYVGGIPTFKIGKPGMGFWNTKKGTKRTFRCPDCRKPLRDIPHPELPTKVRALALAVVKGLPARNAGEGFCTAHCTNAMRHGAEERLYEDLRASLYPTPPTTVNVFCAESLGAVERVCKVFAV